jgi:hypothetical protein
VNRFSTEFATVLANRARFNCVREQLIAFGMGIHQRLGSDSPVQLLNSDVMMVVFRWLWNDGSCPPLLETQSDELCPFPEVPVCEDDAVDIDDDLFFSDEDDFPADELEVDQDIYDCDEVEVDDDGFGAEEPEIDDDGFDACAPVHQAIDIIEHCDDKYEVEVEAGDEESELDDDDDGMDSSIRSDMVEESTNNALV